MTSWRKVEFFDRENIQEQRNSAETGWGGWPALDVVASAVCANLYLGGRDGKIHKLDRSLTCIVSWAAYTGTVLFVKISKLRNILCTVGLDTESAIPLLKIWDLEKLDSSQAPTLIQSHKLMHGAGGSPVTALAIMQDLSHIAVGLDTVAIVLKGDLSKDQQPRIKKVFESKSPVLNLGFRVSESSTMLFIATSSQIVSCRTAGQTIPIVLDTEAGAWPSAITPQDREQEMVIAKPEAVYFFEAGGRGPCFLIHGEKTIISWFKGYLVIVSKQSTHNVFISSQQSQPSTDMGTVLTIYDLKSKFIAYQNSFGIRRFDSSAGMAVGQPIKHVFSAWGELYIITDTKQVLHA